MASSTMAVMPRPLRVTSIRPSARGASGRTVGMSAPVRITSRTCSNRRLPKVPAGCERAKSSSVKPRAFNSATASASPTARAAVVLAVGARLSGQASAGTPMSRCTVAVRARAELELPVKAIKGTPKRAITGTMVRISSVSPELDSASTASSRVIMPDIAVARLPGMHEKSRRAGARQRRGDLAADVAGLAHTGDHDAPAAIETNAAGACKRRPQTRHLRAQAVDLHVERLAAQIDEGFVGELEIHPRDDTAVAGIKAPLSVSFSVCRSSVVELGTSYEPRRGGADHRVRLGRAPKRSSRARTTCISRPW